MAASVVDFPRARGAGHEHEALVLLGELLDDGGQLELLEGAHFVGDHAHGGAYDAALPVDVAAKARQSLHAEGQVQLVPLLEAALLIRGEDAVDQPLRVARGKGLELL